MSSHQQESFEQRERRQMALSVLDSPELLMLVAESESDVSFPPSIHLPNKLRLTPLLKSIAGQRRRFTRMLCGYDDEDDAASSSKKTPKKKDRDQGSEAGGSSSSRFTRE